MINKAAPSSGGGGGASVDGCKMPPKNIARIAVLIPCYNEAATIAQVVHDFKAQLPEATIYVFDNNSKDETIAHAAAAGAVVRRVLYRGKGNVVRRMFADVEADVYLLVDGDDTYAASDARELIDPIFKQGLDMVVGARISDEAQAYRLGHRFGNVMLTSFATRIFGRSFSDMLSGYRAFSRRFVKSFPAHSAGFETETELTVHALELRMPVAEVPTRYKARPEGSASKLNTYRDGFRILITIMRLFKMEKPLPFFSIGFAMCLIIALVMAEPLLITYLQTGLVPRLPTALLCSALTLFGTMLLICGIILETVTRGRTEAKRLAYLSLRAPCSMTH